MTINNIITIVNEQLKRKKKVMYELTVEGGYWGWVKENVKQSMIRK